MAEEEAPRLLENGSYKAETKQQRKQNCPTVAKGELCISDHCSFFVRQAVFQVSAGIKQCGNKVETVLHI